MSPASAVGVLIFQTSRWNPTHMSDTAWLALIGLATVFVAAVPATVTAITTRHLAVQARDHAATAATAATSAAQAATETNETLGVKNGGDKDAMTILWELVRSQEQSAKTAQEVLELNEYAKTQIHRLNGTVRMMWVSWAEDHGIDPDVFPPPEPSPKENP